MFIRSVGKPTEAKKTIYFISATVLGLGLSVIAHGLIEMAYLRWAARQNLEVVWYGGCALHPVIQGLLLALGLIGGFMVGRVWWRMIYVDRFWEKLPPRRG